MKIFSILSIISTLFLTSFYKKNLVQKSKVVIDLKQERDTKVNPYQNRARECRISSEHMKFSYVINDTLFDRVWSDTSFLERVSKKIYRSGFGVVKDSVCFNSTNKIFKLLIHIGHCGRPKSIDYVFKNNYQDDTLRFVIYSKVPIENNLERCLVAAEPFFICIDLNQAIKDLKPFNNVQFIEKRFNKKYTFSLNN
jgi:hypothetical protein